MKKFQLNRNSSDQKKHYGDFMSRFRVRNLRQPAPKFRDDTLKSVQESEDVLKWKSRYFALTKERVRKSVDK